MCEAIYTGDSSLTVGGVDLSNLDAALVHRPLYVSDLFNVSITFS